MNGQGDDDDVARVMARNAEILECKRQIQFWTQRLAQLEAPRRREALLASFDLDSHGTWSRLTEEEKQDREWVIKGVSGGVFGRDPWSTRPVVFDLPQLPEQFREDRDVVLAFVARDGFHRIFHYHIFEVPESLRDDREVMFAVCAKNSRALRLASPRLQDDRDVVLAALGGNKHYGQHQLEHASVRLRSDKEFILEQVKCTNIEKWERFSWLKYAQLGLEDEKQVALAALKRTLDSKNSKHDSSGIVEYLSPVLRNDRDIMLQFVEDDWRNLSDCSDRLKSSEEFVNAAISQDINALAYCLEAVKEDTFSKRDKNDVLRELEDGDLWFDSLPTKMKTDPDILLAALKGDSASFEDIPVDLRWTKDFIQFIPENPEEQLNETLPEHLQEDEEICLALLKKKYYWWETMFQKVPSLYRSREAILAISDGLNAKFLDILRKCPFRDDEEVMLLACENQIECLQYASERLKSDRDFVLSLISRLHDCAAMVYVSWEFQINNVDIVQKAIGMCGYCNERNSSTVKKIIQDDVLAPDLWQNRLIVLACLKKGWPILRKLDRDCPLLDDGELVRLAVTNCGLSELEYASSSLKADRDFALSVVKINGLSLRYVDTTFKRDDEIVTEAIADTCNTILDCFRSEDDFGYLVLFASRVRSRLELHKSFLNDFLRGISVSKPHVAPAKRCRLPILDRGSETSTAFKKLIAEYLGVPMKTELRLLRTTSENLRKLRY